MLQINLKPVKKGPRNSGDGDGLKIPTKFSNVSLALKNQGKENGVEDDDEKTRRSSITSIAPKDTAPKIDTPQKPEPKIKKDDKSPMKEPPTKTPPPATTTTATTETKTVKKKIVKKKVVKKVVPAASTTAPADSSSEAPKPKVEKGKPPEVLDKPKDVDNRTGPPVPPPMPPLPPPLPGLDFDVEKKSKVKLERIETLRRKSVKRPCLPDLMKELTSTKQLNHVACNDRSKPILPKMKKNKRDSISGEGAKINLEEDTTVHHILLQQIEDGVKLKKVETNDRSKPFLSGLGKLPRQLSLDQRRKTTGNATNAAELNNNDSTLNFYMLEDIDALRDELESSHHLIETEMEKKQLIEKKNRDLKCLIITMEAEMNQLKAQLGLPSGNEETPNSLSVRRSSSSGLWKSSSIVMATSGKARPKLSRNPSEEDHTTSLSSSPKLRESDEQLDFIKAELEKARKNGEMWEEKCKEEKLMRVEAQRKQEAAEEKASRLERELDSFKISGAKKPADISKVKVECTSCQTDDLLDLPPTLKHTRRTSTCSSVGNMNGIHEELDSEDESSSSESEDPSDGKLTKKEAREIKLWENKLKGIKEKQKGSRLNRRNLLETQKQLKKDLKVAKKKHAKLQKEVDKVSSNIGLLDEEDEEEEEDTKPTEPEEEEEEESSSSDEEEDDLPSSSSSSESDDSDGGLEDRLEGFNRRIKRREAVVNGLRKGNYLLRANIERLKDEADETRLKYQDLEHELNSVLADV